MAEKLSSPRATGSPPGLPAQSTPPKLVQLPVLPPPEPSKKLISPNPARPFSQEPRESNKRLTFPKPPQPKTKPVLANAVTPFREPRALAKRLTIPKDSNPNGADAHPSKLVIPGAKFRRVATIKEISNTAWRDELMPAHFDNYTFHVESGAREGGRRIVVHEFPKRDICYSEDMGRSATTFTIRGYCITYPRDLPLSLFSRDYRFPRNLLQERLDRGGAGTLQLPTMRPVRCVCQRYRMTEEEKLGGYVVFDMQFVEVGQAPFRPAEDTQENMIAQSKVLQQRALDALKRPQTSAASLPRPVR